MKYLMKKIIAVTALSTVVVASNAHAGDAMDDARKTGVFFSSAIAGAVLAGPIGMVAAAVGGVWLDEKVEQANELEGELQGAKAELANANGKLSTLHYRLAVAEDASQQYAQIALDQLQLEMLFKTGKSEVTDAGKHRLALLADFMKKHAKLAIRLDGYTDPRGDEDFNLKLSSQRVDSVVVELKAAGLDEKRISRHSHGADQSVAVQGDYDGYALERVVRIQITNGNNNDSLAQVSLLQ